MRRWALGLGYLSLCLATGCGGNVVGGTRDPEDKTPATSSTGAKSSDPEGTDNPNADTDLGDCVLGPKETYGDDKPCAWVADGHCYQSRDMACNCACPRARNRQCSSGFDDGPAGHVWVSCN